MKDDFEICPNVKQVPSFCLPKKADLACNKNKINVNRLAVLLSVLCGNTDIVKRSKLGAMLVCHKSLWDTCQWRPPFSLSKRCSRDGTVGSGSITQGEGENLVFAGLMGGAANNSGDKDGVAIVFASTASPPAVRNRLLSQEEQQSEKTTAPVDVYDKTSEFNDISKEPLDRFADLHGNKSEVSEVSPANAHSVNCTVDAFEAADVPINAPHVEKVSSTNTAVKCDQDHASADKCEAQAYLPVISNTSTTTAATLMRARHPVYVIAERALLREKRCLEQVTAVAEEVVQHKRCLSLPDGADGHAQRANDVTVREVIKPVPCKRPIAPRPPLDVKQKTQKGRSFMRYSALGDAVVRCAWGGSR